MSKTPAKDVEMDRLSDPPRDPELAARAYTAALAKVCAECGPTVKKEGDKTGAGGTYRFVGHEHLVKATDAALSAAGFVVEPPTAFHGPTVLEVRGQSGTRQIWLWTVTIPVSHSDGDRRLYEIACTTAANDKASYVASTAADRTLRLRLCGLAGSKDENPEHDTNDAHEVPARVPESHVEPDPPKQQPKRNPRDDTPHRAALRAQFKSYGEASGIKVTTAFAKRFTLDKCGEPWDVVSERGCNVTVAALKELMETGEVEGGEL